MRFSGFVKPQTERAKAQNSKGIELFIMDAAANDFIIDSFCGFSLSIPTES